MPKLSDTQLVILSAAARREDGTVLPLPRSLKVNKAAATTVLKSLLKKGLVAERPRRPMRPTGAKPGTAGARPSPSPIPACRRSALCHLYPQVDRGGPGAGLQLAGCPA